jgi:thiamine-phosphate pyrophosphorylase
VKPLVILIAGPGKLDALGRIGRVDADIAVHLRFPLGAEDLGDAIAFVRERLGVPVFASATLDAVRANALAGVHCGGEARSSARAARAMLPRGWISVPAHDDDDIATALRDDVTAAYVSPIFETPGKGPTRGLDAIVRARAAAPSLLLYALGGVDASNAASCVRAGADGVAVIRAVLDAPSPRDAVLALHAAVRDEHRKSEARSASDALRRCP